MSIRREIIESEIRTTGGKQVQDEIYKVSYAIKDLNKQEKDLLFIKNKLESQGKKNTEEWKKNETAIKANREATAKQREELTKLNSQMKISEMTYNQLSKRAAELRGKLNNISKEANPKKWNEYNRELGKVNTQMGKVRAGSGQTGGVLGKLGKAAGVLGITFGGAFAALKIGEGIMKSASATADKFDEVMGSVKTTIGFVAKSIATMDFKNFFKNFKEAIKVGKEYAQTQDKLDDRARALKMSEADAIRYILEREQVTKSMLATEKDRIKAADEIIAKEDELARIRTEIGEAAYNNEVKKFLVGKNLSKQQLEDYIRNGTGIKSVLKEMGKGADEELDKIVGLYDAWKQADASALENTMRTKTRRDSLLAQGERQQGKTGDSEVDNSKEVIARREALYARLGDLAQQFQTSQKSELDQELDAINDRYQKEIDLVKKSVDEKIITETEGKNAIGQIEDLRNSEIAIKRNDAEIKLAQESKERKEREDELKQKAYEEFENKRLEFLKEYQNKSADELLEDELAKLQQRRDEILKDDRLTAEQRTDIEEAYQEGKKELQRKFRDEELAETQEYLATVNAMFSQASDLVSTLQDTEIMDLETSYDRKIELAGENKAEVSRLEEEKEKKIKAVKKKYADADFAMKIGQINASTAQAIMSVWGNNTLPYPAAAVFNGIMTALIAGTGIAQMAKANSERQRAKSLFTGGYSGDGGKYEVAGRLPSGDLYHRGEYVVASEELNNHDIRSFIGGVVEPMRMRRLGYSSYAQSTTLPSGGFANGGYSGNQSSQSSSTAQLSEVNSTMNRIGDLLSRLETQGVNANFDETKIKEMRDRVSKQQYMESRATK